MEFRLLEQWSVLYIVFSGGIAMISFYGFFAHKHTMGLSLGAYFSHEFSHQDQDAIAS